MEAKISKELEAKLQNAETLEDFIKACAEEGIEVTEEQLEAELKAQESGELNENALDNVAGGSIWPWAAIGLGYLYGRWKARK